MRQNNFGTWDDLQYRTSPIDTFIWSYSMRNWSYFCAFFLFFSTSTWAQSQNITEDLARLTKQTVPFVSNGLRTWSRIYTDKNTPVEKRLQYYINILMSPSLKENKEKVSKLEKLVKNESVIRIDYENAEHSVEAKIPIIYGKTKAANITLNFVRVSFKNRINRWQLKSVIYSPRLGDRESASDPRGLEDKENEKNFLDLISSFIKYPHTHKLPDFVHIDPSVQRFYDDMANGIITFNTHSYEIEVVHKIHHIAFYGYDGLFSFKYVYFKNFNGKVPGQTGWLIVDTGDMLEYFIKNNRNTAEGYYSQEMKKHYDLLSKLYSRP